MASLYPPKYFSSTGAEYALRPYALFVQALRHQHGRGLDKDWDEAVLLLRLSVAKGCVQALSHLGMCYLKGNGVAKDEEEAVRLFRRGSTMSCVKAEIELGKYIRDGTGGKEHKIRAFQIFKRLSKAGSTDAMVELGKCFLGGHGYGRYPNLRKATRIFKRADFLGNYNATYRLALHYAHEEGKDPMKAITERYERSARDGSKEAMFHLACYYLNGEYIKMNVAKAITLLSHGASLGDMNCHVRLAQLFEIGLGVQLDFAEAFRLYKVAHDNESLAGTANLGVMYREGMGVPKDIDLANSLFRQSMEGGNSYGEACLGYSYFQGLGVEKDFVAAFKHFEEAYYGDSNFGTLMLGLCYQTGCGVAQDVHWAFQLIRTSLCRWSWIPPENVANCYRYLADCYWNGRGVMEDKDEAAAKYWEAAEQGCIWALSILASLHCQGDIEVKNCKRKLRLRNYCIERGCVTCKVELGKMFLNGNGLEHDTARGCQILEETVTAGSTAGMIQLGVCYLSQQDKQEKAFQLFQQASKTDLEAAILVGFCLEHGFGVVQNSLEAIAYYQQGFGDVDDIERDSPAAAFALSYSCDEDENPQDDKSTNLFSQAVLDGSEHCLARLGFRYRHGETFFGGHDITEDCSANAKLSIRLDYLGFMYRCGRGIEGDTEEGIRLLLMAEKKGSNFAGVEIGKVYSEGAGLPKDDISAEAHFRRAALNGCTSGSIELARSLSKSGGSSDDVKEVFRVVKEASEAGNVDAHMLLADSYESGVKDAGIHIDEGEEVRFLKLAADEENSIAQNTLGAFYLLGRGGEQNTEEGLRLIRASARAGDRHALCNLGSFYVNGDYVEKDIRKGVRYLRKSRNEGHWLSFFDIGKLYRTGRGLRRDDRKAWFHFLMAEDPDNPDAYVQFGLCLRDGIGTEKDENDAAEQFRKAAAYLDNKRGKLLLGLCYRAGEGVEKSDPSAMGLFRLAV